MERTLAIIKPDAVAQGDSGLIMTLIELNKFVIARAQKIQLTKKQAELFYEVHKERPFYKELVDGMISGPVVVMALERDNAVLLCGSCNSSKGTKDPEEFYTESELIQLDFLLHW